MACTAYLGRCNPTACSDLCPSQFGFLKQNDTMDAIFNEWVAKYPDHPLSKAVAIHKAVYPKAVYNLGETTSRISMDDIAPHILASMLSGASLEEASESVLAELVAERLKGKPMPNPQNVQWNPGVSMSEPWFITPQQHALGASSPGCIVNVPPDVFVQTPTFFGSVKNLLKNLFVQPKAPTSTK